MKKICVYTCITGKYDDLKEIKNIESNIDYYCFTNNKKIKSNTWKVVYIEDSNLSDVLLARKIKILGHPTINQKYDIFVWLDAAVEFRRKITDFVSAFLKTNDVFVGFKHGLRTSIDEEMNACLRFRKENIDRINRLREFYKDEKYDYSNGLIESTVLIKKMDDAKVQETMMLWFNIVEKYSHRDQLSFNYCIFKTGLNVRWINEKVFNNEWFKWHEHSENKNIDKYMIYYGNIDDYDYNNQIENFYNIENNTYEIKEKILSNTNRIYIELTKNLFIRYNIIKLNKKVVDIEYHNTFRYDGNNVFFKKPGFIILKGDFKKGENLNLKLIFDPLEEYEKNELIEYLVHQIVDLENVVSETKQNVKEIEKVYNELVKVHNNIINSNTWKLTEPLRIIRKKIKRK
ncbi:MAG: DUF616 domain-containing protein [Bacilli bacterium]|nr:DUF616 domain-containing protein [Bacilli bacterium]